MGAWDTSVSAALNGVPLDDRGLLLGDGLFETLLWREGALVLAPSHAARMARGAALLGLPAPDLESFLDAARTAVATAGLGDARAAVRVTLTAGSGGRGLGRPTELEPRLFATAATAVRPTAPAALIVAQTRRNQASPTSRLKTLSYLDNVLARREAAAAGADEAVMLNTLGEVAGAAAANLFWVTQGRLVAPPVEAGRLDGIMAAAVVEAAHTLRIEVQELSAGAEALADAEAVFLTNSLIGVRPARRLDARAFEPHRLVERLADAVRGIC
jgi:branched-chain amino acid aminotransferase/4-amino-4-deoxychorismate lyase